MLYYHIRKGCQILSAHFSINFLLIWNSDMVVQMVKLGCSYIIFDVVIFRFVWVYPVIYGMLHE